MEGKISDGKPTVLFLCTHNAGRSQMAWGFSSAWLAMRRWPGPGGSEPANEINPAVVQAMAEVGIDISAEFPKPWTDEIAQAADVVVTMGCGDACPILPGRRFEAWAMPDPAELTLEQVRPIRDAIEERVRCLLSKLNVPAPG